MTPAEVDEVMSGMVAQYRAAHDLGDDRDVTVIVPMIPEVATWSVPPHVTVHVVPDAGVGDDGMMRFLVFPSDSWHFDGDVQDLWDGCWNE